MNRFILNWAARCPGQDATYLHPFSWARWKLKTFEVIMRVHYDALCKIAAASSLMPNTEDMPEPRQASYWIAYPAGKLVHCVHNLHCITWVTHSTHFGTPRTENMRWDEMNIIMMSSCAIQDFAWHGEVRCQIYVVEVRSGVGKQQFHKQICRGYQLHTRAPVHLTCRYVFSFHALASKVFVGSGLEVGPRAPC